jgi:DNA-binding response OmpR family regulator
MVQWTTFVSWTCQSAAGRTFCTIELRMPCRSLPSIETESMMIPVLAVTPNNEDDAALDLMLPRPKWALEKAHSLAAAIAKLQKRNAIRLILCESELAPDSWRQMLEYLKHMDEPPLLIVTSRQADEQLWAEALNLGAYDVLAKPFNTSEVTRILSLAWLHWRNQHVPLRGS